MPKEKDAAEKTLESHNEVFAEIVNITLFKQPGLVRPEDLEDAAATSQLKLSGVLTEQERDTAKRWKNGEITLAFLGIENQSRPDPAIPLRIVGYDGGVYKGEVNQRDSQRRARQPVTPFYPSVTIVLYFGLTPWKGPRTLAECFPNMPEELRPFIPDYPIHIVELAFLTPEEVAQFKSDFRIAADYLVQRRTTGIYVPSPLDGPIVHVDETLKLMGALTGDRQFEKIINELTPEKREGLTMYHVFQGVRDEVSREYEGVLADRDRMLADRDRMLADQNRLLANRDRMLADQNRMLENQNRMLADEKYARAQLEKELRKYQARFGPL